MRLKVLFFRFLFALTGFLLPLVFLAGAAPYVINAAPVKKRLVEELKNWTGSHVELSGPVTIESFFSLSLNAQNVEFYTFKRLPQLKTLKAEKIIARIAWMDLFAGRLDFDKIKISGAEIEIRALGHEDRLTAAETLLAMSRDVQFDVFVLQDSEILIEQPEAQGLKKQYLHYLLIATDPSNQDIEVTSLFGNTEQITIKAKIRAGALREPGAILPLELKLESPNINANFAGTAKIDQDWHALGDISLSLQDPSQLGKWLNQPYFDELRLPVSLSGKADITKSRVIFDEASFSIAEQNATGEFDLALGANPKLLGSAAFGRFDLAAFMRTGLPGEQIDVVDPDILTGLLTDLRLDLRLSTENISFKDIETGQAAFTLLGENGQFSTEIAHMAILGGGVFGHAEFGLIGDKPGVTARLTGENLDIYRMQDIADISPWLSGDMNGNIEASASGSDFADMLSNTVISGEASISDGGQVRLNLNRLASMQKDEELQGWDGIDSVWSDFEALRFAFITEQGIYRLSNIVMVRTDGDIKADGVIDTKEDKLDLRLTFVPKTSSAEIAAPQSANVPILSINGPWRAPVLRSVGKANRAATDASSIHGTSGRSDRL